MTLPTHSGTVCPALTPITTGGRGFGMVAAGLIAATMAELIGGSENIRAGVRS